MGDLPLPEALIEQAADAVSAFFGSEDSPWDAAVAALEAALAFRDESGHRGVWSAEEVELLIRLLHECDGQLGLAIYRGEGSTDEWKAEATALVHRARAALARVRGPEAK